MCKHWFVYRCPPQSSSSSAFIITFSPPWALLRSPSQLQFLQMMTHFILQPERLHFSFKKSVPQLLKVTSLLPSSFPRPLSRCSPSLFLSASASSPSSGGGLGGSLDHTTHIQNVRGEKAACVVARIVAGQACINEEN